METSNKKPDSRINPFSMHINPDLFEKADDSEKRELVVMRESTSLLRDALRRFKKNKFAMVALGLIVLLFLFAFIGPLVVPYSYDQFNAGEEDQGPNSVHLFGTDKFGRDLLVRNMYGARISLSIGLVGVFISLFSSVLVTRTFLHLLTDNGRLEGRNKLFGA